MNAQVQAEVGPALEIAEYNPTAIALTDLAARFKGVVYDVTAPDGMKAAKEARNEIRSYRTALEKRRKELKEPALRRAKLIDEEAKLLTERIVALEQPIAQQIEAEEQRIENEKRAREEAEQRRVQQIIGWINDIKLAPARATSFQAGAMEEALLLLKRREIGPEFAEFQKEAEGERAIAIATLTTMLAGARAQEAEAQRIAEERAELARLQKEAKERAERDEAERKARIAAEEKAHAERERLLREQEALIQLAQRPEVIGAQDPTYPPSAMFAPTVVEQRDSLPEGVRYGILLAAMKHLQRVCLPGSEEAEIVEQALAQVGEL